MNRLSHESSPYLLQHAHNPVDWYPWGEEALQRARMENKPILVSIGYAACHWCHVMERESFENEKTAEVMNSNFINIKIDREERPDLDHIYMDAVQAMTGSGGWPLNVFLTPEGKPFYGGTYFPPTRAYNRASWEEVLLSVSRTFNEKRHEVDAQAENLTSHLLQANSFGQQKVESDDLFHAVVPNNIAENILKSADREWGGFGKAPKFPQTFTIQFLLRNHFANNPEIRTKDSLKLEKGEGLSQALLSLDKMIEGGIYDQIGGGFSRYSTDTEWLAPHFEKMLYDNALLLIVLSEAYSLTRVDRYKEVIEETISFVERELMHHQGGFYSALDADSEGVEGKFYVWSKKEIENILGNDASLFTEYYDVSEKGNWEGNNILRVRLPLESFAKQRQMPEEELKAILKKSGQRLMEYREKRVRPALDDKILLGWNALMNSALSRAYAATGIDSYLKMALTNMDFLLNNLRTEADVPFRHTWKEGVAKYPAFLDDMAYLIQALIDLHEVTGNTAWLEEAKKITGQVIEGFSEPDTVFFYYTHELQKDVIIRKKEVYDGAVPSGNAVMATNLYKLSVLLDRRDWRERSETMIKSLGNAIVKYPTSFGVWACLLQELISGSFEIVVVGKEWSEVHKNILGFYLPHRVLMAGQTGNDFYPLMRDRNVEAGTLIFLCRDYACEQPVERISRFISLINNTKTDN